MLQLYNTLTKKKEIFKPINPGKVSMYVCGMTVYDDCHLGHGRMFVVFDMVSRYLRSQGYEVNYVRNITDIDDKIINRANERGEKFNELAERFIQRMHEDERALKLLPPTVEPRATEFMPQIIDFIQKLIEKDFAYVAENGDVYYAVTKFADYGKFSHQSIDKLKQGARVEILDVKRDPLDFALWKLAKPNEPSWESPWGAGRPGWHIECSAMSAGCLGEQIDLHGGGLDLIFPHHQNEIAQSEALFNCKFVNYWMHNGYVQVDREKMSKSLGNFSTIRDVLAKYDAETLRYFLLASNYRSPINYSTENLESARAGLERLYLALRGLVVAEFDPSELGQQYRERFVAAMNDDFNTPLSFSVLFDLAREINKLRASSDMDQAANLGALLKQLANVFGLLEEDPEQFLKSGIQHDLASQVELLIAERNNARSEKQWIRADELRDQLLTMGIVIEDSPQGTIWRK
jgi:cysteinyl-tRNA synthetase